MATYLILSGMAYEVTADTEEQALEKFYADDRGEDVEGVEQHEHLTHVISVSYSLKVSNE